MPPSPARFSPGRDLKADNHKRGRSLESGMRFIEKEDDLALFNEVQNKESDNFLLQSNDDLDDLFATRLRYFSDCKLAVSVPARGENSDFLNADSDKNDYDWLITPPDTPLFPSLDDETPQVTLAPRGRPRSQPISISRSSTMEKSYQSSRGSASPNRLSTSPTPAYSTYQSRSRPSSASHSSPPPTFQKASPSRRSSLSPNKHAAPSLSPPPTLHSTNPSRRLSPPPSKPSISVSRSATPTPRRRSTDSSTMASARRRGASPVKTSRGNSMSPKIKAWQSNIPGFSSEVPPNLRTSLADRPASNMRGSSPASRNGLKSGRQSTSPSGSRSVGSSQSHERDQFNSRGKGSIASSGDDDIDSMLSLSMSTSSAPKSISTSLNDKALGYSKRPNRIVSQSSAPKRFSDMELRRTDQQKAPHNMFRPLLSSVPTSTFYSGKASAAHRAMVSRNSSITTSSNTSTDLAHDTEDSEQSPEEVTGMSTATPLSAIQAPLFSYDDGDVVDEVDGDLMHAEGDVAINFESVDSESFIQHNPSVAMTSTAGVIVLEVDISDAEDLKTLVLCSKCGCSFDGDLTEGDLNLCPDCRSSEIIPMTTTLLKTQTVSNFAPGISADDTSILSIPLPESPETGVGQEGNHDAVINNEQHCQSEENINVLSDDPLADELSENRLVNHPETGKSYETDEISGCGISSQQNVCIQGNANSRVEVPEVAGIPLLFRRSTSCIGQIVQNRSFASSDLPSADLAYVRNTAYSLSSSVGHGSMSTSWSTDLSSAKHVETRVQRQHSGKKSELENVRYDIRSKHQRSTSNFSGASTHNLQFLSSTTNSCEEGSDLSVVDVDKKIVLEKRVWAQESTEVSAVHLDEGIGEQALTESHEQSVTGVEREGGSPGQPDSGCGTPREHSSNSTASLMESTSATPVANQEDFTPHLDGENSSEFSDGVDNPISNPCVDSADVVQDESGLDTPSKIGAENDVSDSSEPESVVNSPTSGRIEDEMQEPPMIEASYNDPVEKTDSVGHGHGVIEESTVMLEDQGGMKARSLTLDESTDTILFCSSVVQNLAYEAASKAIEKENSVLLESSRPTVTIVGKANTDRRALRSKTPSRRTPKSQKAKKPVAKDQKSPSKTESEETMEEDVPATKIVGAPNKVDSLGPPKLESKCNCTIM